MPAGNGDAVVNLIGFKNKVPFLSAKTCGIRWDKQHVLFCVAIEMD